jgi:hypothetical protein
MASWNAPVPEAAVGEQECEVQVRRLGAVEGLELRSRFGDLNDL